MLGSRPWLGGAGWAAAGPRGALWGGWGRRRTGFWVSPLASAPPAPAAVAGSLPGAACIAAAAAVPSRDCVDNELEEADVRPVELIESPNLSCSAPGAVAPGWAASAVT